MRFSTYRAIALLTTFALLPSVAVAQLGPQAVPVDVKAGKTADTHREIHGTTILMNLPAGQEALAEYHRLKSAGLLPSQSGQASKQGIAVGTQQLFSVYNFNSEAYENIDFTLKKDGTRHTIWVETALLDGTVTDQQIDDVDAALGQSTPAGSINPAVGIIENDELIFGNPPNVDGDSKTDIMLMDVRDDPSTGLVITGFFNPRDLTASGNNRDMVYLDTDPGFSFGIDNVLATAAHEYQHLIMAAYDSFESTFVNEAQSEYAELVNGYRGRNMAFLADADEHGTMFFTYRSGDVKSIFDRERGQLFTLYLAEQVNPQTAGAVTRQSQNDQSGYFETDVLGSRDAFEELIADFHVANLINDTSLGAKYGYSNPFYTNVRTSADVTIDGRTNSGIDTSQVSLEGGAVHYVEVTDVQDVVLAIDVNTSNQSQLQTYRDRMRVRALLERPGGAMEEVDVVLDGTNKTFSGAFDRIRLVLVNGRAQNPASPAIPVRFSATWGGGSSSSLVSIQYDDGNPSRNYFTTAGTLVQMTRFVVPDPDRATLDLVSLAPFFDNQFGNSSQPETAPRDIQLLIVEPDGAGAPDLTREIYSMTITDPRAFSGVLTNSPLNHFDVDLSAQSAALSSLPPEIFIGFTDTGTDENYQVFGPATNTTDNVSYLGFSDNTGWQPVWDWELTNGSGQVICCDQQVVPVRAQFLVSNVVSNESVDVPESLTLLSNYPNPFSDATELVLEVGSPTHLEVEIFDVLGRRVATVADAMFAPGRHNVTVDGDRLSSGTYFYRVSATIGGKDEVITGTMIRL